MLPTVDQLTVDRSCFWCRFASVAVADAVVFFGRRCERANALRLVTFNNLHRSTEFPPRVRQQWRLLGNAGSV